MNKFNKLGVMAGLIASAVATPALASIPAPAPVVFTLDQSAASGMVGPFGTVTLTQNGVNQVDVAVNLTSGTYFVSTGTTSTHNGFVLNLDLGSYAISNLTSGFTWVSGSGTNVPYGTFNTLIECTVCGSGGSNKQPGPLDFSVTSGSGISFSDFTPSTGKGGGYYFSADVWNNGYTGNVATTMSAVPEPRTYAMLLVGLGLIGLVARRNSRKGAANFV